MILPPVEYPTLFHVRNVPLLSFEFVRDDSLTEVVSEEPYRIRVCLDSDDAAPTLTLNRALNVVDVLVTVADDTETITTSYLVARFLYSVCTPKLKRRFVKYVVLT